jgi:hypothetical protein
MTIILRYVDCFGFIRERFFNIVSVPDMDALTLKIGSPMFLVNISF